MEQARDDLANELASGTPNYAQAVAGATRYCPLIAHVLRSLEKAVRNTIGLPDCGAEPRPACYSIVFYRCINAIKSSIQTVLDAVERGGYSWAQA